MESERLARKLIQELQEKLLQGKGEWEELYKEKKRLEKELKKQSKRHGITGSSDMETALLTGGETQGQRSGAKVDIPLSTSDLTRGYLKYAIAILCREGERNPA